MQDRFRFRFYDKDKEIMIKPADEMSDAERKNICSEYRKDEWYWCIEAGLTTVLDYFDYESYYKKNFAIMQCTGLKDKNGKLIYEGDIVKIANGSINGKVAEGIHVIKWLVNKWQSCPSWLVNSTDTSHYIEVIGNIYENSELYKGE